MPALLGGGTRRQAPVVREQAWDGEQIPQRQRRGRHHNHGRGVAWKSDWPKKNTNQSVAHRFLREPVGLTNGNWDQESGRMRTNGAPERLAAGNGTVPDAHDPIERAIRHPMLEPPGTSRAIDPAYETHFAAFYEHPGTSSPTRWGGGAWSRADASGDMGPPHKGALSGALVGRKSCPSKIQPLRGKSFRYAELDNHSFQGKEKFLESAFRFRARSTAWASPDVPGGSTSWQARKTVGQRVRLAPQKNGAVNQTGPQLAKFFLKTARSDPKRFQPVGDGGGRKERVRWPTLDRFGAGAGHRESAKGGPGTSESPVSPPDGLDASQAADGCRSLETA